MNKRTRAVLLVLFLAGLEGVNYLLSGSFASGFSMALMAKDLRTAADLADQLGIGAAGASDAAALWADALSALGKAADHTEIYRFLAARGRQAN